MRLLVDNQLPVALARYLAANGWECAHVQDVGLDAAEDRDIWLYAKDRGLAIVTKDEDFQTLANCQLATQHPAAGGLGAAGQLPQGATARNIFENTAQVA